MPVPLNPPSTTRAVDRLDLRSELMRETQPSAASCLACACLPNCFDAEASGMSFCSWPGMCFEGE